MLTALSCSTAFAMPSACFASAFNSSATIASLFAFTGCKVVEDEKAILEAGKIVIGITDYEPMDYKFSYNPKRPIIIIS